jgi:amino acid transporter
MGLLIAALGSFFVGGLRAWNPFLLELNWTPLANRPGFWTLFAIFFPAVTGFTQGVSMSGDLKDPGKSLPLGTFMAVGVSLMVYIGTAVLLASGIPKAELARDTTAMQRLAAIGW